MRTNSLTRASRIGLAIAAVATLTSCGPDGDSGGVDEPQERGSERTSVPTADSRAATYRLWFTAGEQFEAVEREGPAEPHAVVAALLSGPTKREKRATTNAASAIPPQVELRSLEIDAGRAELDLSAKFMRGVAAEPARRSAEQDQTLAGRVGQVTYTLTALEGIDSVEISAAGQPVGEPVRRAAYAAPDRGPERVRRPYGAASPGTRAVQKRLARLGYLPRRAVDGISGYRTQQATIAFQAWEGLEPDGIVGPLTSQALDEARRPKPTGSGPSRRIEVDTDKGVTLLIRRGRTARTIHTSSGKPGFETPTGNFEVFRKEEKSWSVPYKVWLPWASYFNNGIAFHSYPEIPVTPASHGCVRVPAPEARIVYRFAKLGTTVIVS